MESAFLAQDPRSLHTPLRKDLRCQSLPASNFRATRSLIVRLTQ